MHWEPVPPGRNSLQTTKAIPEPISLKLTAITNRTQNSLVTTAVTDRAQDNPVTVAVTDRGRQVAEDAETVGTAALEADNGEGEIDSINGFSYDLDLLYRLGKAGKLYRMKNSPYAFHNLLFCIIQAYHSAWDFPILYR